MELHQFPEKLIPVMISKAKKDEKLPVYGDGSNVRDWILSMTIIEVFGSAFIEGKAGEVYNFGGNAEMKNLILLSTY